MIFFVRFLKLHFDVVSIIFTVLNFVIIVLRRD